MSFDRDFLSNTDLSTLAIVLCFGTITFVTSAMAARTILLGDGRAMMAASTFQLHNSISPVENSFVSIFVLLYHLTLLGLVLLLTYVMEHHPPFPHAERPSFDPDYLAFLVVILLFSAFTTLRRNDGRVTKATTQRKGTMPFSLRSSARRDDTSQKQDDESSATSDLPSIATRQSIRSENSVRSRDNRSGGASTGGGGTASSRISDGSIEDVDIHHPSRKTNFLDILEEGPHDSNNKNPHHHHHHRVRDVGNAAHDLEDVRLLDEDSSERLKTRTVDSRDQMPIKSSGQAAMNTKAPKSASRTSSIDLLNIHQSLEWKGLLSALFLVYQLTDAASYNGEMNLLYNGTHVGTSCFVFLTGFGHAMYFYTRNTFRLGRVLHVLFRLNATAFLLCATLSRPYIFYFVCPLHTFAFLVTYAVMKAQQASNYSKYGLRTKLLALALIIFCTWDLDLGLFGLLFSPFLSRGPPTEILPYGALWSWNYHSHMHHWIGFVGIVYAVNYPITTLLLEKKETLSDQTLALAKSSVGGSLLVALTLWTTGPFTSSKLSFDSTFPYFAFLPVLSYVYFRNATAYLREHHLTMLKTLGKFSLETFLFHHYFFLADDGQSTLVLVPGYPKCNVIVSLFLLLGISRTVNTLTAILCTIMFPYDDNTKCIRFVTLLASCALVFYIIAYSLESMELSGPNMIAIAILLLGAVVYQTIIALTWTEYKNAGRQLSIGVSQDEETQVLKTYPPIIGMMVILVFGVTWYILAMVGASGGKEPLSRTCEAFVNEGVWAPVSPCTEFQRGFDTRLSSVGAYYGECDNLASLHWGWRQSRPNLHCRVRPRSADELQQKLAHRKIVFIGDLTIRSLFHAMCRLLGDTNSGNYDSTVSYHADVSTTTGSIRLEYKWAPLAFDQVSRFKDIRMKEKAGQSHADLIIAGGGTLDRLHVWATDENQESHKVDVQKLSKELEFASAPTIWCTPTTINTAALGNDEKRSQMNEMAISDVRKMYADLDVEQSADFVLDGPSYSRGRVSSSYDGVLYPHDVYDAGIQVIANSFDWLLPSVDSEGSLAEISTPDALGDPFLGIMMICFSIIGLYFFDGYLGFSFLSSLFVRKGTGGPSVRVGVLQTSLSSAIMPNELYDEAFVPYHHRLKLPSLQPKGDTTNPILATLGREKKSDSNEAKHRSGQQGTSTDIFNLLDNDSTFGGAGGGNTPSRSRRSVIR